MTERKLSRREIAEFIFIVGVGVVGAVGATVLFAQEQNRLRESCFTAGQIDEKGLKTPLYNPRTECRMLFFEDENGKPKRISGVFSK